MEQIVLKPENLSEQLRILTNNIAQKPSFDEAHMVDPVLHAVLEAIKQGDTMKQITIAESTQDRGMLYCRGARYVPADGRPSLQSIRNYHDTALAAHPGRAKMCDLLRQGYYWKDMRKGVDRYGRNSNDCQRCRGTRYVSFRVLRRLPVPEKAWEDLLMDFVPRLLECIQYDAIWVLADRLSKMQHFVL